MKPQSQFRIACLALALLAAPAAATEWSYEHGTESWGALDPAFAACSSGTQQSPVDVVTGKAHSGTLPALSFHYASSADFHVDHLGHTVQAAVPAGNTLTIGSKTYQLLQFHFHTPSENFIDGEQYPLELHLVHRASDQSLAVVAILFDEGAADPQLQKIVSVLPQEEGQSGTVSGFNLRALVPHGRVYRFKGSLTTPPCSEGVSWHVVNARRSASLPQLAAFAQLFSGPHFPGGNRRPVQSLHGRRPSYRSGE
ncbi:carbonic anhydrase [Lysobacter silvisoli]|nr:carbonic anhydrase family protein [Lysobacter silvisoli]